MSCEYARRVYGVPAEIGRRVEVDGEPGVIARDMGNYIGILLDKDKPNHVFPYHPCSKIKYFGMGKVRKMTRSQRRYQQYMDDSEWFGGTFGEWLKTSLPDRT